MGGRVLDFSDLKRRVKGWIDENWDHAFLICDEDENARKALEIAEPSRFFVLSYNPTEDMAKYLLEEMCPRAGRQWSSGHLSKLVGNRRLIC